MDGLFNAIYELLESLLPVSYQAQFHDINVALAWFATVSLVFFLVIYPLFRVVRRLIR